MKAGIKSVSRNGRRRSMATVGIFAVNNAIAEKLPFTALNVCNVKGRHFTYNV